VSPADQKALEASELKPERKSAYDYGGFNKATAAIDDGDVPHLAGTMHHGD
jgi:hypothetical protein